MFGCPHSFGHSLSLLHLSSSNPSPITSHSLSLSSRVTPQGFMLLVAPVAPWGSVQYTHTQTHLYSTDTLQKPKAIPFRAQSFSFPIFPLNAQMHHLLFTHHLQFWLPLPCLLCFEATPTHTHHPLPISKPPQWVPSSHSSGLILALMKGALW